MPSISRSIARLDRERDSLRRRSRCTWQMDWCFRRQSRGAEKQGETIVNLPNGSYLLSATTGGREDGSSYGETRVTVADEDVTGATIHLQKALEMTIEASVDTAGATGGLGDGFNSHRFGRSLRSNSQWDHRPGERFVRAAAWDLSTADE